MLKRVLAVLYPEATATFDSAYVLETSVARLSQRTRRSVLGTLFKEAAIGRVSAHEVRLRHYSPWFRNDFAPEFVGAFDTSSGRPTLSGHFRTRLWTRVFLTFWFGFCVLWTLGATAAAFSDSKVWGLPFAGLLMIAFGLGLLYGGRAMGARDIDWLSRFIAQSLRGAT